MGETPARSGGFEMNRPTIVALLYIGSFLAGITTLIGVIFAYVWRGEPHEAWEDSHWQWHIRTFWIGLAYGALAVVGTIATLGLGAAILFPLLAIWFAVRAIKALVAAQKQEPMPNVETWLF
jgi:uncharacterized membrane protein